MKILFYSPVKTQAGLGCERWHCDVTESLRNQFGDEIEIMTGNLGITRWTPEYLNQQLLGTPYRMLNYKIILASLIPTPGVLYELYKKIKSVQVVHFIHGFMGQDIIMGCMKLITGKRIIVGHHAPIFHSSKIHNAYMKYVSRYALRIFDGHMVLNKKDYEILKNWGLKNVNFIPSGIKTDRFTDIKRKKSGSTLRFFLIGRYDTPQKGFDLAVKAISKFNKENKNSNTKFVFAGSGAGKTIVEEYAEKEKNIINKGFTKYEDIPSLYQNSDVLLLSSREEPFGLILIEAWASGIPVLATKTEGPLDMLKEGKNGWFINEISEDGILSGISKVYQLWKKNPNALLSMEKFSKETGKRYDISKTANSMHKLFEI